MNWEYDCKASSRAIRWCKFSSKTMPSIPGTKGRNHDRHMTLSYKKFTLILCSQSKETMTSYSLPGRPSISLESTSAWVYPDDCNFCQKTRIKYKGQIVLPKKNSSF